MSFSTDLENQLIEHEGLRLKPYRCPAGKLTIGVGRNLDDNGLSLEEVMALLRNDITVAMAACLRLFPSFLALSESRRRALIDMAFNLGEKRLGKFEGLRRAIAREDWAAARKSMENSLWHTQVGKRAKVLEEMMFAQGGTQ